MQYLRKLLSTLQDLPEAQTDGIPTFFQRRLKDNLGFVHNEFDSQYLR